MATSSSIRRVDRRAGTTPVLWLRASYRIGAIVDGLAAIPMLFPSVFATIAQIPGFQPGLAYQYAMGMGASLMLGWSGLLIWADRKPIERKGILLLTIFPVIAGLVINGLWAVSAQFLSLGAVAPIWVLQAALVVLLTFSYMNARDTEA